MAATRRRSIPPLIAQLEEAPYRFDFYQAVRLIELDRGLEGGLERPPPGPDEAPSPPPAVPVGESADPRREAVRFASDPSLAFPASDILKLDPPERKGGPRRMLVRFMGLAGAFGPLPKPVTEFFLDRQSRKDTAWRAFFDIFNHRLVSLMVRVRKLHRIGLDNRRPQDTNIARYLYAFMGLGTDGVRGRMTVEDRALQRYAGLLAHRPRTAAGLEQMFEDYYGAPMRVAQFEGAWFTLEDDQLTRVGSANHRLGATAVLGRRFWEQQAGIELVVGPLDYDRFLDFLPGGRSNHPLLSMVLFYVSPEFNFTARLKVRKDQVPEARLGGDLRLGWTTWLKTQPFANDDDQVRIVIRDQSALTRI